MRQFWSLKTLPVVVKLLLNRNPLRYANFGLNFTFILLISSSQPVGFETLSCRFLVIGSLICVHIKTKDECQTYFTTKWSLLKLTRSLCDAAFLSLGALSLYRAYPVLICVDWMWEIDPMRTFCFFGEFCRACRRWCRSCQRPERLTITKFYLCEGN